MSKLTRRLRAGVAVAIAVAGFAFAGSAGASTVPDQSQQLFFAGGGFSIGEVFMPAQVFTAGVSGELTSVSVQVGSQSSTVGGLHVAITAVVDGHPTVGENACWLASTCDGRWGVGATLAETAVTVPSGTNDWVSVSFPSPATVTAGTQYALVLWGSPGTHYNAHNWNVDVYPGGGAWFTNGDEPFFSAEPNELAFQTFVTVADPDVTPPELTGGSDSLFVQAGGLAGAVVSYQPPTAVDAVDGPVAVSCLPASGSLFAIGMTQVTCAATDAAENTALWSFGVTVTLAAFTSAPPAQSTVQRASFSWSSPVPTRYTCSLDRAQFAPCSAPRVYNGLAAGTHSLCVMATDDIYPACHTWEIVSPGAPLVIVDSVVVSGRSATVTFHSDQAGSRFQCALDGGAFRSCSSGLRFNGLARGAHAVMVVATNFAGEGGIAPGFAPFVIP